MNQEQFELLISVLQEISFGLKRISIGTDELAQMHLCLGKYDFDHYACQICNFANLCKRELENENI